MEKIDDNKVNDIRTSAYRRSCQREQIGARYEGATLAQLTLGGGSKVIANWLRNPKNFLIMIGSPGVGKTFFCSAIFDYIFTKTHDIRYYNENRFLSVLRKQIQNDHDYIDHLKRMCETHFLILDDLGSAGFNPWRSEVLFEFIDNRYQSMYPTIITSNLDYEKLKLSLGERGVSRLFAKENLILDFSDFNDKRMPEDKEKKEG